jgi:hypothetical protein
LAIPSQMVGTDHGYPTRVSFGSKPSSSSSVTVHRPSHDAASRPSPVHPSSLTITCIPHAYTTLLRLSLLQIDFITNSWHQDISIWWRHYATLVLIHESQPRQVYSPGGFWLSIRSYCRTNFRLSLSSYAKAFSHECLALTSPVSSPSLPLSLSHIYGRVVCQSPWTLVWGREMVGERSQTSRLSWNLLLVVENVSASC